MDKAGIATLVQGSDVSLDEMLETAPANRYREAGEAERRALIADVI